MKLFVYKKNCLTTHNLHLMALNIAAQLFKHDYKLPKHSGSLTVAWLN